MLAASGLNAKQVRDVQAIVKPISTTTLPSDKLDLKHFWEECEETLTQLGPSVHVVDIEDAHIRKVAPYLVGRPIWRLYSNKTFADWYDFQEEINSRFGLSKN